MWTTGKMKGFRWMVLPRGAKGGLAIAINLKCQREPITLCVFDWPEEGNSEGEEE
jgi:hypothetical protein